MKLFRKALLGLGLSVSIAASAGLPESVVVEYDLFTADFERMQSSKVVPGSPAYKALSDSAEIHLANMTAAAWLDKSIPLLLGQEASTCTAYFSSLHAVVLSMDLFESQEQHEFSERVYKHWLKRSVQVFYAAGLSRWQVQEIMVGDLDAMSDEMLATSVAAATDKYAADCVELFDISDNRWIVDYVIAASK